ncbi:MAG TPA: hypothetical protein VF767_02455 [Bryobacteraceae bacterium]
MHSKTTIGKKLVIAVAAMLAVTLFLGVSSVLAINRLSANSKEFQAF